MNKQENVQQNNPPQPAQLSTGKQILGKSWQLLTGLCAKTTNTPLTGEIMGKKLLWGIGGGLLGHFSGMSFIGSLVTAMTGMVFNQNLQGMGSSIMDLFQGKIGFANRSVLGPLIGGAAGFGISAFMLNGGFLPSLLTGIGTACVTDHVLGNQKNRQQLTEKPLGLANDGLRNTEKADKSEEAQKLSQSKEVDQKLDLRPTNQRTATESLSDKELLSIERSSPQESMNRFEGKPPPGQTAQVTTEKTENSILPDNNRVKIGMG